MNWLPLGSVLEGLGERTGTGLEVYEQDWKEYNIDMVEHDKDLKDEEDEEDPSDEAVGGGGTAAPPDNSSTRDCFLTGEQEE